jgi:hypothetical protein
MLAARLVLVAQRLLQTMRRHLGQPRVLGLGFNQFVGLLFVTNPGAPAVVFTPLLQTGVPHRPARVGGLLRQAFLSTGQLDPKPTTGLHARNLSAATDMDDIQQDRLRMGWPRLIPFGDGKTLTRAYAARSLKPATTAYLTVP